MLPILLILISLSAVPDPDAAFEALRRGDWEAATVGYGELIESNPWQAAWPLNRGVARMRLGHYAAAAADFQRALELGGVRHSARYYLARCAALAGDRDTAIRELERLANDGFDRFERVLEDEAFSALIDEPRVAFLTRTLDLSGLPRSEGWREDIRRLDQIVRTRHVAPFHSLDEAAWRAGIDALLASIEDRTDLEVLGELLRLVAGIGDGHTVLYPPHDGRLAMSLWPVRPYWFGDDLYLRAVAPAHRTLLGARVVAIGGVPIEAAWPRLARLLVGDNAMTRRWLATYALRIPQFHAMVGLSESADETRVDLVLADGSQRTVTLGGMPPAGDPLSRGLPNGWLDLGPEPAPRWLRDPERYYLFEDLAAHGLVYFRFNQVRDQGDEPIEAFVERLFAFLDAHPDRGLIVDLRGNNGGNSHLNPPLVRRLAASPIGRTRGRLYVLIGRRTFSAAQNLTSDLERETEALFVGEPTGSRPNFYGEDHRFRLPWSGLEGSVSTRYWQGAMTSDDDRRWIAPDLAAPPAVAAWRAGRDPALEAVFADFGRRSAAP